MLAWSRAPPTMVLGCEEKWPWFAVLPVGVQPCLGGHPTQGVHMVVEGIVSEPGGPSLARLYL